MIGVAAFIAAFAISAAGYAQNWRDPQFWNVHGDRLSGSSLDVSASPHDSTHQLEPARTAESSPVS